MPDGGNGSLSVWTAMPSACLQDPKSWRNRCGKIVEPRLERRYRVDDFRGGHNGSSVVRYIDVESSVHVLFRVIRHGVPDHGSLVAELSGKAHGRFDAGMRYLSNDNELMDAMLLELQI